MNMITEGYEQMSIAVDFLTANGRSDWDAYVQTHSDGLPLHLSAWRDVMQQTYGYETCYLMARSEEQIVGVLPLFIVPSRLTGRRAMTMPGGLCADNAGVATALLESALESVSGQASRLVVQDARHEWVDDWHTESNHVYWIRHLDQSEDDLWRALDGNIRRQIRKAKRNELDIEIGRGAKLLDEFYDMFSQFTHQVGTPVFSKSFLQNVADHFPDGYSIAVIYHENKTVAGYFQLEMNDTLYGMWGAALPETLKLRPSYLALWGIMEDAIKRGFNCLDMGRSPAESSASKFKGQWGGTSYPIYQTIITEDGHKPVGSMAGQVQSDERLQLFMKIWSKVPLSWTRFLGPKLRWHVPFA